MEISELYYWGFLIGILFILFLYNLFLFISTKEISFLYYSLIVVAEINLELIRSPLQESFYNLKFISTLNEPFAFFGCFSTLFYSLFLRDFLVLHKTLPSINKIITGQLILFSLFALSCFSPYDISFLIKPLTLLAFTFLFIVSIISLKRGNKSARFIVLAGTLFTISVIILLLKQAGFHYFFFQIGIFSPDQIGAVMFYTLLSFALGDKINILKKEKIEAQKNALVLLEEKVQERTAEVVKQKQIIEQKNKEVEEKNKDITDSITYAKRIQSAKLPDKNEIQKALPDSFILFKPKDIVSGDFYYFHRTDKAIFIASADCTGHGVPGAFMSLIGSEKLDDALTHSDDTSEILAHLNKGIKTSLKQSDSDESTRDGMDIALCSLDTGNCIVSYAGANRPLWIIRNGSSTVEEIKATKKAIGGFTEDNQHFDSHTLQLQPGDSFYIFSDGYADTFSGTNNKKLTTKKFKELLLSIQHKSMAEQETHLDNFVENWKAGTEQVDDILVIGVRM